jgi:hypothetical protein
MDLKEIGWEGMDWMHPARNRDQWRTLCEHDNEPWGSIKGGEFFD